ncbi:MAG: outer membrane beta-barrel protein [Hyphomonadaceae bacterium]|nr:outer membrane beta-barrel protein [Hyphomonadaceae bacterium]
MIKLQAAAVAAFAALAFAAPANAQRLDNFQIKVGVSGILPDESGDPIDVDISDEWVPSLQIEYFFNDNVSAELLCCVATHDVATTGGLDLGEVTHFPPTLTLKYRWTNFGQVEPYVGAGVNYTAFIDDEPPAGMTIDYDESFGLAVQAGFDYRIDEHWGVNFDVRYVEIGTDVTINNSIEDSVDINPWIISTSVAYRF